MMVPFSEIVERIKDIVSHEYGRKVFDKDVADVLGISRNSLRVYKVTNHYPMQNIVLFCQRYGISVDWMLFDPSFEPKKIENAQMN